MEYTNELLTIADLRNKNHFLQRLLSETKLAIKSAIKNKRTNDLNRVVETLEENGIKDLFELDFNI